MTSNLVHGMASVLKEHYPQASINNLAYGSRLNFDLLTKPTCPSPRKHGAPRGTRRGELLRKDCRHIDCVTAHVMEE